MNIEGITEMRHHLHSICPELFSKTHPHHLPSTEPFISKFPWSCDPPIFSIISGVEWELIMTTASPLHLLFFYDNYSPPPI